LSEEEAREEKLPCVFYDDISCPVRMEMHKNTSARALEKYFQPVEKGSDEKQVFMKYTDAMKDLLDRFMGEFSNLHTFCQICPIKFNKEHEKLKLVLSMDKRTGSRFDVGVKGGMKLLEQGIRAIESKEENKGDVLTVFYLIPTLKGDWIREHAKKIRSSWEGSYIPLIIYKNETGVILVDYKEVDQWSTLTLALQEIFHIPIRARGD
jgi:hypothetical protein